MPPIPCLRACPFLQTIAWLEANESKEVHADEAVAANSVLEEQYVLRVHSSCTRTCLLSDPTHTTRPHTHPTPEYVRMLSIPSACPASCVWLYCAVCAVALLQTS